MKGTIALFILLLFLGFTPRKENPGTVMIDLDEAVEKGLVQVEVKSLGGYSGGCISIELTPVEKGKYMVKVPAGIHFLPEDEGDQTIIVVDEQMFALAGKETKRFKVDGYCSEADDSSPAMHSAFTVGRTTNENLIKLGEYLSGASNISEDIKQSAVWAVANGKSVASIYEEENEDVKKLRTFVCELLGKPNLWYNKKQNVSIGEDRRIVIEPVQVKGIIAYKLDKPSKLHVALYREDGEKVMDMGGDRDMPRAGNYEYDFEMEVKGWPQGNYYVEVSTPEKVLLKQPFEI